MLLKGVANNGVVMVVLVSIVAAIVISCSPLRASCVMNVSVAAFVVVVVLVLVKFSLWYWRDSV